MSLLVPVPYDTNCDCASKLLPQSWDRAAKHQLWMALSRQASVGSPISESILAAVALLQQQNTNSGPMKAFVFTDGFDQRGTHLAASCRYAESMGIQVIGVGVGMESTGVCQNGFIHWAIAQNPTGLADAFRMLASDTGEGTPDDKLFHEAKLDGINIGGRAITCIADIHKYATMEHFNALTERMRANFKVALQSGNAFSSSFTIDICFLLDCTGSMGGWIEACKQQISGICRKIQFDLKVKHGRDGVINFAFVAYRDYGHEAGDARWDVAPFSRDLTPVLAVVNRQRPTGGGNSEDVQGAMDRALELKWTASCRFMILIADAPGHTPFCCPPSANYDSHPGKTRCCNRATATCICLFKCTSCNSTRLYVVLCK
jgi:hypothetical protein